MRISCMLKAAEWADTLGRDQLTKAVEGVDWVAPTAPYSLNLYGYAVETAEWLAERLAFERIVNTTVITPVWYCTEMLALRDAEALKEAIEEFCQGTCARIRDAITRAINKQRWWESACLLSDGLHYIRKLQVHLERLRTADERLSTPRRVGFEWPALNCPALEQALEVEYGWIAQQMSVVLPRLPAKPDGLPDYPGQFLHTATERALECVLKGDAETLRRLFPFTFVGCLAKHDQLRVAVGASDPFAEAKLAVAFAPVLDLVEVSGYSFLMSEAFPDRPTWPIVAQAWDVFLAAQPAFADALLHIVAFSKQGMSIHPRSILRTRWDQDVRHLLRQLPTRRSERGFGARRVVSHGSALIRAVVHPDAIGWMEDGADVFVAMYLLARPGAQREAAHHAAQQLARRTDDEGRRGPRRQEEE